MNGSAVQPALPARAAANVPRPQPQTVKRAVDEPARIPPLKLVGLAEDVGADGPVRTAILSSGKELFFAKEGDRIANRYRVVRISGETVELSDEAPGSRGLTIRLALK